jgi:hypothetical protein
MSAVVYGFSPIPVENVGLRFPARNLRTFNLLTVDLKHCNCPLATNAVSKDSDTFSGKSVLFKDLLNSYPNYGY